MRSSDTGLTTIEDVRATMEKSYEGSSILNKIKFKAWSYHSESRNKNSNKPFTFNNYTNHMTSYEYLEQVNLNMLDCEDLGGKAEVQKFLAERIQGMNKLNNHVRSW